MGTQKNSNQTDEMVLMEEKAIYEARTVFLFGEINDRTAFTVCKRLIALSKESGDPISMFISSPGGHVESGDTIHDMIQYINAPVTVIGTGWVGSAAAHVYLAAPKERRICLPNTRFLIHQPAGGVGGQATDIAIQAQQLVIIRQRIAEVIAQKTGQPLKKVLKDIDRDYWMSASEALDYGLVSRIIKSHSELLL